MQRFNQEDIKVLSKGKGLTNNRSRFCQKVEVYLRRYKSFAKM